MGFIVDAAVAVGEVGVADPAGLHLHDDVVGAGVGDDEFDDGIFGSSNHAADKLSMFPSI